MRNYYKLALNAPIDFGEYEEKLQDRNVGLSMMVRGLSRGRTQAALYKSGVTGQSVDMMMGAVKIGEHGIMNSITGFMVDLGHILLMCGGIYLLLASFGWVK